MFRLSASLLSMLMFSFVGNATKISFFESPSDKEFFIETEENNTYSAKMDYFKNYIDDLREIFKKEAKQFKNKLDSIDYSDIIIHQWSNIKNVGIYRYNINLIDSKKVENAKFGLVVDDHLLPIVSSYDDLVLCLKTGAAFYVEDQKAFYFTTYNGENLRNKKIQIVWSPSEIIDAASSNIEPNPEQERFVFDENCIIVDNKKNDIIDNELDELEAAQIRYFEAMTLSDDVIRHIMAFLDLSIDQENVYRKAEEKLRIMKKRYGNVPLLLHVAGLFKMNSQAIQHAVLNANLIVVDASLIDGYDRSSILEVDPMKVVAEERYNVLKQENADFFVCMNAYLDVDLSAENAYETAIENLMIMRRQYPDDRLLGELMYQFNVMQNSGPLKFLYDFARMIKMAKDFNQKEKADKMYLHSINNVIKRFNEKPGCDAGNDEIQYFVDKKCLFSKEILSDVELKNIRYNLMKAYCKYSGNQVNAINMFKGMQFSEEMKLEYKWVFAFLVNEEFQAEVNKKRQATEEAKRREDRLAQQRADARLLEEDKKQVNNNNDDYCPVYRDDRRYR